MHRNNTVDSFPERIRNAYNIVLNTAMDRYQMLRKSDWSLLAGSQKLFAYADSQAVDGIPIDWFVRGCLNPKDAPVDYRKDRWDVLKKNRLYPIIDTINKKISDEFRTKVVFSGVRSTYTTIYLTVDDPSKVRMRVTTGFPDKSIAKWVEPSRDHYDRNYRSTRDRKRSRDDHDDRDDRKRSPARTREPSPKRSRVDPPSELSKLMAESARVLAELTAVTKMIAEQRAQTDSTDPKILAEQFLASLDK